MSSVHNALPVVWLPPAKQVAVVGGESGSSKGTSSEPADVHEQMILR